MASELRVNTSTNRVGLGTITYTDTGPIISGITTGNNFKTGTTNVHSTGVELVNINTAGATATFGGDLSIPDTIVHTGDTNTKIRFPAADTITAETSGNERFRIDSSGRIGLGIANPDAYFSSYNRVVMGRTNDTGGMTIVSSTTSGGYISFADGTSGNQAYRGMIAYQHSGDYMTFATDGGVERLRIDSNGRLLVGTTSTSSSVRAVFQGYHGGGDDYQARVQFQTNQATNLAVNQHLANLLFTNSSGSVGAEIRAIADGAWGTNDYPGRLEFYTTPDGSNTSTERLRIDANGRLTLSNSEGIKLSAKTSSLYSLDGSLSYYSTTNGVYLNGAGASGWLRLNASGPNNNRTAINIYGHSYGTADTIDFRTNSTERLRIDSGGDFVFINADSIIHTGADTSRLRLFGGSTNSVSNGAVLTLHGVSHSSGNYADLAAATGGSIRFRVGTSEKVRINSSGDDGLLKIADNNTSSVSNHGFRFGSWGIQMRDTNGYNHWYIRRNYGGWQTSPQITFKGDGRTGVNRTDPAETLDVDGGARFRSYVYIGDGFYIKSNAFGGNTNTDTGISINQGGRGGCSLLLVSRNYNAGTGTSAGIYRIKWYYDGNNAPNTHHMSGDNFISFGTSGSNTLTINGGGGNQIYGIIHITG